MDESPRAWWGSWPLAPDRGRRWQIGPLSLLVGRRELEWRLAWHSGDDPFDGRLAVAEPTGADLVDAPADHTVHRFAVQGADALTLSPALADRPVVVRPEMPFHLPGGREARVYVSTPLWVRIAVAGVELIEIPSFRMSDTWFGPSTRIGELCYASRTSARLRLELLPLRMTRAVTQIRLVNRGAAALVLERIKVPVPSLALFGSPAEGLWTHGLTVTRTAGGATEVELGAIPSRASTRLAAPRASEPLNAIARALGAFIG